MSMTTTMTMRRRALTLGLAGAALVAVCAHGEARAQAQAQVQVQARIGAPAPAFTLADSNGGQRSLAEFRGKIVVLEWTNHDCPYVGKHYRGNAMQALQRKWTAQGVVWLSVISSAPGQQGHVSGAQANALTKERNAAPSAVLFDPTGKVGRAYGATATPHMYVVKGDGALAYMGGIDDRPSARLDDLKGAKNFVDAALTELAAGKPVSVPSARVYGCSVKYAG